jgi:hypothetical protein
MKKISLKIFSNKAVAAFRKSTVGTLCIIVAFLFIMGAGCDNEKENEIVSLKGTKWKLAGIVDVQTGELKELEPKDCEECYTLEFDTDSTALLQSVSNEGRAYINRNPPYLSTSTERGEGGDGNIFVNSLYFITSYKREGNELKFFYQKDGENLYLLYKLVQS